MSTTLSRRLRIRGLVYVASERIPHFWPMRTFIHHNPLHGFEEMPFEQALVQAEQLFEARSFLPWREYQAYLEAGKLNRTVLQECIRARLEDDQEVLGIPLSSWIEADLLSFPEPFAVDEIPLADQDVLRAVEGESLSAADIDDGVVERLVGSAVSRLLSGVPLYLVHDQVFGTSIAEELDELVIKSCLDFLDEGQSVWSMPRREKGFYAAWRDLALRNGRLFLRGLRMRDLISDDKDPEIVIHESLERLGVPRELWQEYLANEISRLHGWAGFLRWRSSSESYYWAEKYPADLVDYLAIRLVYSRALLEHEASRYGPLDYLRLREMLQDAPALVYLRLEYFQGRVLPTLASRVERIVTDGDVEGAASFLKDYVSAKTKVHADLVARRIRRLMQNLGVEKRPGEVDAGQVSVLLQAVEWSAKNGGMVWLDALERSAMEPLLSRMTSHSSSESEPEHRPFAQALFCIDTRSERIRRRLEQVGDYQTFGIAGFFGVPLAFVPLDKGSELHLSPALLSPRNLVLELPGFEYDDEETASTLGKILHDLKESILAPFVTVEAIGLVFGVDMIGKTLFPRVYSRWRKPSRKEVCGKSRLLVDKLTREQADSIVRAVQRSLISMVLRHEPGIDAHRLNDDLIRALREIAMGNQESTPALIEQLGMDEQGFENLIRRLREDYRINPDQVQINMERLGRIGFTLEEQAGYVQTALRSIGLVKTFSRFVLLVGHGSTSQNNPYESALDCGACGGNHGLVNARVLAQMANRPAVRRQLRKQGIDIPDDTWFVPALHDTTTDEIRLVDMDLLPPGHHVYADRLLHGIRLAGRQTAAERMPELVASPRASDPDHAWKLAQRNATDWSQVRPEWGLSGNCYIVIGRRELTRHVNLSGRAFLHSYDYRADPRGRLLQNILTGPLVVAQWINMEHYFSTVDNERYGAGSKVYHNVACRVGVMSGNLSDLRTGLPAQTVFREGRPYHDPVRLIAVVEAPLELVQQVLDQVASIKMLAANGWLRFLVRDPEAAQTFEYIRDEWIEVDSRDGIEAEGKTS